MNTMKPNSIAKQPVLFLGIGLAILAGLAVRAEAATDRVTVRPADNGDALINPGMGWVIILL